MKSYSETQSMNQIEVLFWLKWSWISHAGTLRCSCPKADRPPGVVKRPSVPGIVGSFSVSLGCSVNRHWISDCDILGNACFGETMGTSISNLPASFHQPTCFCFHSCLDALYFTCSHRKFLTNSKFWDTWWVETISLWRKLDFTEINLFMFYY